MMMTSYMYLECEIETPCGTWSGIDIKEEEACAVSIIRAGDSMLEVRDVITYD